MLVDDRLSHPWRDDIGPPQPGSEGLRSMGGNSHLKPVPIGAIQSDDLQAAGRCPEVVRISEDFVRVEH
jgi:hypothetical protein